MEAPENSVAAVVAARDVGADGVEFDVWMTADKHLVVHHDRSVRGHSIPASARAQLADLYEIASLDEILTAAGSMTLNVEVKSTRSVPYNLEVARAVAEFLDAWPAPDHCLVSSFSLRVCDEVRRVSPQRKVGWLVQYRPAMFALAQVLDHGLTSAHLPFSRLSASVVEHAQNRGIELHVWTPTLERDLSRMLDLAVNAIITDDVALAMDLRARHRASQE